MCPYQKQLVGKNKHHYWKYPNENSEEMTYTLWVKFPKGKRAFGSSRPLYVGDEWYDPFKNTSHNSRSRLINMSYQIEFMVTSGVYLEPSFDFEPASRDHC